MRHQKGIKKLGRTGAHRRALLRNLATALFRHERIETTEVKAKALRSYAEKLITLGKQGDLHARRMAAADVRDHEILQKLFSDIGPRFKDRKGGYTRVLKTETRRGDAAPLALIELVDYKPTAGAASGGETVAAASK
jgi:large subunit ribosomal protein L17